ncbi:MAG TPA: c-type cytochrome [Pirellulales bacterium]|jgi:mono/diheme cytochrome c family protein|nr:c-type cytochrome [Pirellulales bacterium]
MHRRLWIAVAIVTPATLIVALAAAAADKKPSGDRSVERGRYLVEHVAMCGQCHTPRDEQGNPDMRRWLGGAPIPLKSPFASQVWASQAPTIAGLPGGWSEHDVDHFLQTGRSPIGDTARAPMPQFRMTADDAAAVAAYLKSLPIR